MYIKYCDTIKYYKTILKNKKKTISDTSNSFEIKCFVNLFGLARWTDR